MNLVKLIGKIEKFEELKKEVLDIVSTRLTDSNQISLQASADTIDDWYCSAGSIFKLKNTNEKEYNILQPSLKGSLLEQIIDRYGGYRTRIMVSRPRSCYSVHFDESFRIHIPIVTTQQSWMVWPFFSFCSNLEQGNVYWTDTKKNHTVFNGSMEDRIHLVMCVSRPW